MRLTRGGVEDGSERRIRRRDEWVDRIGGANPPPGNASLRDQDVRSTHALAYESVPVPKLPDVRGIMDVIQT